MTSDQLLRLRRDATAVAGRNPRGQRSRAKPDRAARRSTQAETPRLATQPHEYLLPERPAVRRASFPDGRCAIRLARRRGRRAPGSALGARSPPAAAVVVLIGLAGLFMAVHDGVSALDARLARLEQQLREVARARAGRRRCQGARRAGRPPRQARSRRRRAAAGGARSGARPTASPPSKARSRRWPKPSASSAAAATRPSPPRARRASAPTPPPPRSPSSRRRSRSRRRAAAARSTPWPVASRRVEHTGKALEAELAKRAGGGERRPCRAAGGCRRGARGRGRARRCHSPPSLRTVKSLAADPKLLAPLEPFASTGVPTAAALARELAALDAVAAPGRRRRRRATAAFSTSCRPMPRSWCASVRSTRRRAAIRAAIVRAHRGQGARRPIWPARSPSWPSCRRLRARRRRPGSRRRRRAPPPSRRAGGLPPTRSRD